MFSIKQYCKPLICKSLTQGYHSQGNGFVLILEMNDFPCRLDIKIINHNGMRQIKTKKLKSYGLSPGYFASGEVRILQLKGSDIGRSIGIVLSEHNFACFA